MTTNPDTASREARDSDLVELFHAAERLEGVEKYPAEELPKMLRQHVVDALMCESEPHVIAEAIGIAVQASIAFAAEQSPRSGVVEREAVMAALRSSKGWPAMLHPGPAADAILALRAPQPDPAARLREAAQFLIWQHDRKGPVDESVEAWDQLRQALQDTPA